MFEQSLVPVTSPMHPAGRWRYLPLALLLHAALFAALAGAHTWSVGEIGEPPVPLVFMTSRPMPDLGTPRGPEPEPADPAPQPAGPTTAATVQPDDVPTDVPPPATGSEEPTFGPASDLPFTGPGGPGTGPVTSDGPGGGDFVITLPGPSVPDEPIRYVIGMTPPQVVSRVEPRYPASARMTRSEGTVVVEVVVETDGSTGEVRVLRGISKALDEAAVTAIRQWRFRPARVEGNPVRAYHTVTVRFELRR
jgi:periplasmic protein TonB